MDLIEIEIENDSIDRVGEAFDETVRSISEGYGAGSITPECFGFWASYPKELSPGYTLIAIRLQAKVAKFVMAAAVEAVASVYDTKSNHAGTVDLSGIPVSFDTRFG